MVDTRRHTAIFGLGITGYSCLRFLAASDRLTVVDTRAMPPFGAAARAAFPHVEYQLGTATGAQLAATDRVIVSPGVPLTHCLLRSARERGIPLISDIELFLEHAAAPVIGITGTNGKSTVTALTGTLLRAAGRNVGVGGNLGEPALDLLDAARDGYVLELSSFQLERLGAGRFQIGVNLNVTADHFDRYADLAGYAASKQRIFVDCDTAIFNRADPLTTPAASLICRRVSVGLDEPNQHSWGIVERDGIDHLGRRDAPLMPVGELGIRGRHNQFNALAALAAAAEFGADAVTAVLREFKGLPHRCQTVAVVDGVTFVNDSKATNVGACAAALEGLGETRRHIVLIAGGDAKGADLTPLREVVGRFVHHIVTLGRDAEIVERALASAAPVQRVGVMSEAVLFARSVARRGDLVLLSPACASLDMYANFEARGRDFEHAVAELADDA
jgi:UDP-N-acetylmuramoylalanine--D-glutamate ligase